MQHRVTPGNHTIFKAQLSSWLPIISVDRPRVSGVAGHQSAMGPDRVRQDPDAGAAV